MSQISGYRLTVAICLLAFAAVVPLSAQDSISPKTAVDSTLFTTYSGNLTSVNWVVCGSTAETEGCYASGSLGPFVGVGAMLESNPSVKGDVVKREIYVVDSGSADSVKLYVYKKTDTVIDRERYRGGDVSEDRDAPANGRQHGALLDGRQ